jgi:hypothetical protein
MPRLVIVIAKSTVVALAGLGALMASLLIGMWVVLLGTRGQDDTLAALLFGGAVLAALFALTLALKRLRWTWRAVAATLLVAGSLLVLPHASCAVEPTARVGC